MDKYPSPTPRRCAIAVFTVSAWFALTLGAMMAFHHRAGTQTLSPARERLDDLAGNLSGGQQQMVALSRGLLNRPRLLLLDEPSIGLAPKLISDTFHKLHEINRKTGTGFIIVEHNLKTLLPLTDRAIILANGKIVYDGASDGKTLSKMLDKIF